MAIKAGNPPNSLWSAWHSGWRLIGTGNANGQGAIVAKTPGSQCVLYRPDNDANAYAGVFSHNITSGTDKHVPMGVKEIGGSATATPGVVAAVAAVPNPSPQAGSTPTPSTVTGATATPSATAKADATPVPSKVSVIAALAASAPIANANAVPGAVGALSATPPPTALSGALAAPGPVGATTAAPAPTVLASAMAAAPTVACTGTVPVPEVALGIVAPPLCVLGISDLPPPSVFATNEQPANALPGVIVVRASMPGPVIPTYGDWDAESGDVWAGASVGGGWSGSSSSEWEG